MDHFTVLIWLIGVVIFTPFCINGDAPITEKLLIPECTPRKIFPRQSVCQKFCGARMMVVYKWMCGIHSVQRPRLGKVWTMTSAGLLQRARITWILYGKITSLHLLSYALTAVLSATLICVIWQIKKPKSCITLWWNTTGIWEHHGNVETRAADECFLHFLSILKCSECFITV